MNKSDKCSSCVACKKGENPICMITNELVNPEDYRFCPKRPREVIDFILKQDEEISNLQDKLLRYVNTGTIKINTSKEYPMEKIAVVKNEQNVEIINKKRKFVITNLELIDLAEQAGLFK